MSTESIFVIAGSLVLISIVVSTVSDRWGIPALVLFMGIGMLAGSDGLGDIYFDNVKIAQVVGIVALIYILFSGGLETHWNRIRPIIGPGLLLANIGVMLSASMVAAVAVWLFDLPPLVGLLLGAIISSTDAAAVFNVLRTRGVRLPEPVESLIELESGSNDPIAVFLTIGLTSFLTTSDHSVGALAIEFVMEMVLGVIIGGLGGFLITWLINRLPLQDGLYPVLTLTMTIMVYGAAVLVHGNGFLAVYVAGLVVGNRPIIHRRSLIRFHEGIAWLMQIAMFLTLGLLVFPSQLPPLIGSGMLLALFLMFVARPLSVIIALGFTRFNIRERLMIAWAGLRGAVPIVLATFPLIAGIPEANKLFHIIFFVVLASVTVQGMSIGWVADKLKLQSHEIQINSKPLDFIPEISPESTVYEVVVPDDARLAGRNIMELQLPRGALVVLIRRGRETIVPSGNTRVQANDTILMLADQQALEVINQRLNIAKQAG
ncbi:potassium/proton antiporter [Herpetosiphon giganteus]|uniref:potassium/proton antiporter n=1 Tax=Herpetosiphon giganteus TaxID=2029754 RepID=UPI001957EF5E|nr:potassium/proton antiporter [Herpetosiphon giganteus]MBM7844426.1 cell volume regulation protein A [Herpetosiphon giganteus]